MHYRSKIYNQFYDLFKDKNIDFHVVSNDYQDVDFPIRYVQHIIPFILKEYIQLIRELNPDVCIFFLHLKDKIFIPLLIWCKIKKIPVIYWGHGINLESPNSKFKRVIFNYIHWLSDAIILYSSKQIKYIHTKSQEKIFIAPNTLAFDNNERFGISKTEEVKKMYGIKENMVVLYISRILPYKGLDVLLEQFRDTPQIALVIVGPGINSEQQKIVDETSNYYYLGEKYGKDVDEIFNIGDVFSTPGHIGLALVQAMYWSIPVVLLNRRHAPEIVYLHNGENGFVVDTPKELKQIILRLNHDRSLYEKVSRKARDTYEKEMQIAIMFKGFMDAVCFVLRKKRRTIE